MIKLTEQEVFNPAPSKYIIDTKTTNKSFIRMYDYLKKRGIENNKSFQAHNTAKTYDFGRDACKPFLYLKGNYSH